MNQENKNPGKFLNGEAAFVRRQSAHIPAFLFPRFILLF